MKKLLIALSVMALTGCVAPKTVKVECYGECFVEVGEPEYLPR